MDINKLTDEKLQELKDQICKEEKERDKQRITRFIMELTIAEHQRLKHYAESQRRHMAECIRNDYIATLPEIV